MDVTQWFIDLVRVETRLYAALEDRLRTDHGLTAGQFQVLRVIAGTANCRVQDIAADIAITVGAVSKSVDRIEAAGWCRRAANPHDRRSSYLTLTEAGERLLAAASPTAAATIAGQLAGMPDDALARSAGLLAELRTALELRQGIPAG